MLTARCASDRCGSCEKGICDTARKEGVAEWRKTCGSRVRARVEGNNKKAQLLQPMYVASTEYVIQSDGV